MKARDAGKVRFVGYSGDNEAAAYAAALPDVAVVQTSISIADQANIDRVLPAARKHRTSASWPSARSPTPRGRTCRDQPGMYKSYAAPYTDRLAKMRLDPAALGFSGAPESAWPELALRFTLSQGGVHTAIIGTTNPENAKANLAAAEKGPLPPEVVKQIRDAFRAADPKGAWTGQQ